MSIVSVGFCQGCASGWSLVQRSPTECGVWVWSPYLNTGRSATEKKKTGRVPFLSGNSGTTPAKAFSFTRFLDHAQRRTTVGRTPLHKWSAHRRDLYLTTHNTHNRHNIHASGGIRTHNFSRRATADLRLRPRGHWDSLQLTCKILTNKQTKDRRNITTKIFINSLSSRLQYPSVSLLLSIRHVIHQVTSIAVIW